MHPSKTLLTVCLTLSVARSADVTWKGSVDGDWANPANWTGGAPGEADRPFFAAVGAGNLATKLTAPTTVKGMRFNNNAPGNVTVTASKENKLTIDAGETISVTAGDHVLLGTGTSFGADNQAITLKGSSIWDIAAGASLTNRARTTKTVGTADFIKTGDGLLVIDANNTGKAGTQSHWRIQAGTLRFVAQTGTTGASDAFGNSANPVTVSSGATVEMVKGAGVQLCAVTLNGMGVGGQGAYLLSSGRGLSHTNPESTGKTVLASDSAIGVASGAALTMTRPIEESGGARSLTKVGGGTLTIASPATYTGPTLVNAGTFALTAGGGLASPSLSIAEGALLDVQTVAPFTLPAGMALGGSGNVSGSLVNTTGTRLQPGGSLTFGALTFQNDLKLAGDGSIEFDLSRPPGSDKVIVKGNLTATGVTPLVIASPSPNDLATGASYPLFEVRGRLDATLDHFTLVDKTGSALSLTLSIAGSGIVLNVTRGVAEIDLGVARDGRDILLGWTPPEGVTSLVNIHRNTQPAKEGRRLIASIHAESSTFADRPPSSSAAYWYWVSFIDDSSRPVEHGPYEARPAAVWHP
jgi:autotransporter-associated beta strand protein